MTIGEHVQLFGNDRAEPLYCVSGHTPASQGIVLYDFVYFPSLFGVPPSARAEQQRATPTKTSQYLARLATSRRLYTTEDP